MSESVKLIVEGKEFEFPVITGTEGEKAIDISKLRDLTGHITLDIGFKIRALRRAQSLSWMGRKVFFTTADTPLKIWPNTPLSWKFRICCYMENCPTLQNTQSLKMPFVNILWRTKDWKPCSKHSQLDLTPWVSYPVWLQRLAYTIPKP